MALYLGLDVGTQGTKGLVIDAHQGAVVARAAAGYGLIEGLPPGAAEQHPCTWLDAIEHVLAALGSDCDLSRLEGVGVSGQQHGFVPLDADYRVIRPAKLWCDTATAAEAAELGVPAGFTASKILWLKRHEPEHWARLRHVALPHDWINFELTGRLVMECGDASGTGLFDARARRFDTAVVRAVDPALLAMLPPLIDAGAPAGVVSDGAARRFGLPAGIPVASGGGDNMMSAIGAGATARGVVVASLGTSGTVFAYSETPVVDPSGLIAPFCDSTGAWLPLLCVMNLTGLAEEVVHATGRAHEALTGAAARVERGCGGMLLMPFLSGERVPELPEATGTLVGMRSGWLDPGKLYRAVLEGTTLNLGYGVDKLRALGVAVERVRLVGGAAHNPLWRQLIADVFETPVQAMREVESAALGAAIQAAWTAQRRDLTDLVDEVVAVDGPLVEPDADGRAFYRGLRKRYATELARLYGVADRS